MPNSSTTLAASKIGDQTGAQARSQAGLKAGPPPLPALTGVRALFAVDIVLFHFSNPNKFWILAPLINGGSAVVSFFILLSGFVLAYNYSGRAQAGKLDKKEFWINRVARLYPVYLVSLALSYQMLELEWHAQPRDRFWLGVLLTPLLLQGWHWILCTFWNTPAWALSCEAFLYVLFPWAAKVRLPKNGRRTLMWFALIWAAGLIFPAIYLSIHGEPWLPNRFTNTLWMRALKYTPPPHVATFFCGILLARLHAFIPTRTAVRVSLSVVGIVGTIFMFVLAAKLTGVPLYPFMHEDLMVPWYSAMILGMAAPHWVSWIFSIRPLVLLGEASYCLYILHFNLWNLLLSFRVTTRLHLAWADPWISYGIIILVALLAYRWIEVPGRALVRRMLLKPA